MLNLNSYFGNCQMKERKGKFLRLNRMRKKVDFMIKDKITRKNISSTLKEVYLKIRDNDKEALERLKISDIDNLIRMIKSNGKKCTREIELFANKDVEIAKISVLALGLLSLAISGEESEVEILPKMIIIRVYHELCCLIPVLISNKEKMELYIKSADVLVDEKQIWRENFSFGKLNQSLVEIENQIIVDSSLINELSSVRKDDNHFYSKSVHNSYTTVMAYSYAPKSEDIDKKMEFNLFGASSIISKNTLYQLNWDTFYLLGLLYKIISTQHHYKATLKNEFFVHAHALHICQARLLLKESFKLDVNYGS